MLIRYLALKTATFSIIAFILGGVIVGFIMEQANAVRAARQMIQTRSDIHDPMRTALDDIVQTHDRGDHALAEAKVRMLASKWTAFMNGDKMPEQFAPLVEAMTNAPATRPAK